jgi:hypothetical protein
MLTQPNTGVNTARNDSGRNKLKSGLPDYVISYEFLDNTGASVVCYILKHKESNCGIFAVSGKEVQ